MAARGAPRRTPAPGTEVIVFGGLLVLAFVAVFVFARWTRPESGIALPFLLIPFMAWAGCRFDERIVTAQYSRSRFWPFGEPSITSVPLPLPI